MKGPRGIDWDLSVGWFDKFHQQAAADFMNAAGPGVELISIEVSRPETREIQIIYQLKGKPPDAKLHYCTVGWRPDAARMAGQHVRSLWR